MARPVTIDPAILRAMQAAGASIDVIIAAVEADAALDNERTASKRAKDAERQRRHRASRDVTVTERDIADSVTPGSLSRPPNENNSNPPTHTLPETNTPARKGNPFPRPEWADPEVWDDFLKNRKRKDMVNTATAHKRFLADIEKFTEPDWPPGKLLEHAAGKGWGSINKPDEAKAYHHDRPVPRNSYSGSGKPKDGVAAALDRRLGLDEPAREAGRRDIGEGEGDSRRLLAGPRGIQ